eukprot:TRINITY_DN5647_c0_g1_i1.p1 TRINITY_DN5647_c0_g1~~TRINITY_DN5647_c0_g1_i1.p1  ORF type:complete len:674 (-),score=118.24 TRINITY_DN5647_c0_g1_i1:226-2247(-)
MSMSSISHIKFVELLKSSINYSDHGLVSFFDETNMELLVPTKDKLHIYSFDKQTSSIHIKFKSTPINVKFSPDRKFVAVQYDASSVSFINVDSGTESNLPCKKNSKVLDYYWASFVTMFFVTSQGYEFYQSTTNGFKFVKEHRLAVSWFQYSTVNKFLVLAGTTNQLSYFSFRANSLQKAPKTLDIDTGEKRPITSNEIFIASLYQELYCVYVNYRKQELAFYKVTEQITKVSLTIHLPTPSPVRFHVIDNLLIMHVLDSIVISFVYDIRGHPSNIISTEEIEYLLAPPLPLQNDLRPEDIKFFQPNLIISQAKGTMSRVGVNLEALGENFGNSPLVAVEFLLRRVYGKAFLQKLLRALILEREKLVVLSAVFDKLNVILATMEVRTSENQQDSPPSSGTPIRNSLRRARNLTGSGMIQSFLRTSGDSPLNEAASSPQTLTHSHSAGSVAGWIDENSITDLAGTVAAGGLLGDDLNLPRKNAKGLLVVEQSDLYSYVFSSVEEDPNVGYKYLAAVLMEYIRSLHSLQIPVSHYVNSVMIRHLVRYGRYYQLHQFLQYHVVNDSLPVACQLLSLETTYPPAYQLALDMLKRLSSPSQIVEVLLVRTQVLAALRVVRTYKDEKLIKTSRLLEAAWATEDRMLFFTVYKYFEQRKEIVGEDCEPYKTHFHECFSLK